LKRAVQRAGADVERCFHQAPFSACWAGEATLHVEADGNGVVGKASLLQPPVAGLDGCLKAALPKIPQSDTGPSAIEIPVSCTPP
jgi:hypothetical protein